MKNNTAPPAHDVLTITVILPSNETKRDDFLAHLEINGDIAGAQYLAAQHGNLIDLYKAHLALRKPPDKEIPCSVVYERLLEESKLQIDQAIARMAKTQGQTNPDAVAKTKVSTTSWLIYAAMYFAAGYLACLNFN